VTTVGYVETATACWRKIDGAGKVKTETASACQQLCSNSEICVGVSYGIGGGWAGTCFLAASNDNPHLEIPCASSSSFDAYEKQATYRTANGQNCPNGLDITDEEACKSAASQLGLVFASSLYDPSDHRYCFFTDDGRSKVYFNTASSAGPPKAAYASICQVGDTPTASLVFLPQCIVEACLACTDNATETCVSDISKEYNMDEILNTDPQEDCSSEMLAHAIHACYTELQENCHVSEEWLDACVQDVCSAYASREPEPLDVVEEYCDLQEDVENLGLHEPTTTTTTTTSQCKTIVKRNTYWKVHPNGIDTLIGTGMFSKRNGKFTVAYRKASSMKVEGTHCQACGYWDDGCAGTPYCWAVDDQVPGYEPGLLSEISDYGARMGNDRVRCWIVQTTTTTTPAGLLDCLNGSGFQAPDHEKKCVLPASFKQCEEFGQNLSAGPVPVEIGSWGDAFPKHCSLSMVGDQVHLWWNNNTGDGNAARDPDGKAYGQGSCCDTSARRVCCGSYFLTAKPVYPIVEGNIGFNGTGGVPPIRHEFDLTNPVIIDRPVNASMGVCGLWTDPHFRVFDYVGRQSKLDIYRYGTYWLVKSTPVWIQGFYHSRLKGRPSRSWMIKLAVGGPFLRGNTFMIEGTDLGLQVWWNENTVLAGSTSGVTVFNASDSLVNASRYDSMSRKGRHTSLNVQFPHDVSVYVQSKPVRQGLNLCLDVAKIKSLQITGQDGHCGNFNLNGLDDSAFSLSKRGIMFPVSTNESLIP